MKLQCQICIINRLHSNFNVKTSGKYLKSTLALGKELTEQNEYFLLHFSSLNKTGIKYRVKNMTKVFVKCLSEGKATLRFEDPPHDLCIKGESIQLKCFMRLLKSCVTGDVKEQQLSNLCNISVTTKDSVPTKLIINDRSEFPSKGLPRTLETLHINGLRLCNFRREILLLKHLVILDLSNNEIENIPPEFGRMPCLSELYVANNKLGAKEKVDWRWLFGPQLIKMLKLLDLSGNNLKSLPKSIWKIQKLVTLKLDNNLLQRLPAALGRINCLRYLTISKNKLSALPCSLMQCHLEYIDLSSNSFHHTDVSVELNRNSDWKCYISSLLHLSSEVVLRNKFYYAPNLIPLTLVQFLDDANMCVCGAPVVNDKLYINKKFELKDFFRIVVFDNNRNSAVDFECYFCCKCRKR
ncbi:leucine-rich repeat protein 1 isoform X2 [Achroia grisella]|uniref:leucine-rich repeat protein 1 isoform X2 n=1 Tax=Achroia grisella TaxID=688607 RepID=UPI0027D2438B|nr:leucine-rich repeat protein 1 isoform X2 [Achroia grisella]